MRNSKVSPLTTSASTYCPQRKHDGESSLMTSRTSTGTDLLDQFAMNSSHSKERSSFTFGAANTPGPIESASSRERSSFTVGQQSSSLDSRSLHISKTIKLHTASVDLTASSYKWDANQPNESSANRRRASTQDWINDTLPDLKHAVIQNAASVLFNYLSVHLRGSNKLKGSDNSSKDSSAKENVQMMSPDFDMGAFEELVASTLEKYPNESNVQAELQRHGWKGNKFDGIEIDAERLRQNLGTCYLLTMCSMNDNAIEHFWSEEKQDYDQVILDVEGLMRCFCPTLLFDHLTGITQSGLNAPDLYDESISMASQKSRNGYADNSISFTSKPPILNPSALLSISTDSIPRGKDAPSSGGIASAAQEFSVHSTGTAGPMSHPPTLGVYSSQFYGACLLVDISGFTKLSSRYCNGGVNGLDQLHRITNGFLAHLVQIVHYNCGDGRLTA